jgi:hypothetical protein
MLSHSAQQHGFASALTAVHGVVWLPLLVLSGVPLWVLVVLSWSKRLRPNPSNEAADEEVAGDEAAGDEVAGDEVAGDEVAGDEVVGDEVVGDGVAATPRKLILPASEPLWYRM